MTIAGWITPRRNFFDCAPYEHIEAIGKYEELRKAVDDYDELSTELEAIRNGCQISEDEGDHPEWHVHEYEQIKTGDKMRKALLDKGFVRVGSKGNTLHFECRNISAQMIQFCKDFASEEYSMDYEFESQ